MNLYPLFKKGACDRYCNRTHFTALTRESEQGNESEMRIFASVRISHHISDSLWLGLLFPRCNTVKDFGNSEKRSSWLYLMMFLIYSLNLCLCACEHGSVFLMLDEEYKLLKKITDNFKRPKQTFFSSFFKTLFTSKSRPTVRKKPLVPNTYHFTSSCWMTVCVFLPMVYLKTLRTVAILFKALQKSSFEKHLSTNWGCVLGWCSSQLTIRNKAVIFFLFFLRRVEEVYEK